MKGRLSTVRRSAAAVGVALSMLVAAGTGAQAAGTSLTNYTASAASQSLHLSLQLPSVVNDVLEQAGLISQDASHNLFGIDERISYSTAFGQWIDKAKTINGKAQSQVFYGTLDNLIAKVLSVSPTALRAAEAKVGKANATSEVKPTNIKELDLAGLVKVGIGTQAAKTQSALQTVASKGDATLLSVDVSLAPLLSNLGLKGDLDLLQDQLNKTIGTINNTLGGVLDNLGIKDAPNVPSIGDLTKATLLHVGVMEADSSTGVTKLAHALSNGATEYRTAHASNRLAGIDILKTPGAAEGLIHVDALQAIADAKLDNRAGSATAEPVTQILGLRVGGTDILNLSTGKITIAGQSIAMPDALKNLLNNLVVNIAGVDIEALHNVRDARPGHAFAQANTLKISIAPAITDPTSKTSRPLFALALEAPTAQASVDAGSAKVLGLSLRKTGLNDSMYLIVGPMLFAAAVLVRRFALSR